MREATVAGIETKYKDKIKVIVDALRLSKTQLNNIDKETKKIIDDLNSSLVDNVAQEQARLDAIQKQIDADETLLNGMRNLESQGANITKEVINQAIKVARAKLDMALKVISAYDTATQAQIDNINRLKNEIAGYEAQMNDFSADTPKAGWLNKSLFGTGADGDDQSDYTGENF